MSTPQSRYKVVLEGISLFARCKDDLFAILTFLASKGVNVDKIRVTELSSYSGTGHPTTITSSQTITP